MIALLVSVCKPELRLRLRLAKFFCLFLKSGFQNAFFLKVGLHFSNFQIMRIYVILVLLLAKRSPPSSGNSRKVCFLKK